MKKLSILKEDNYITHVNIIFNAIDIEPETFTDCKMMNGNIKRSFVNGKVYYFNPFT